MNDELKTIIENLNSQGKMSFLEAASDEQISAFEKKYKITFPNQYREWLLFSDGGECFLPAGVQFYGIAHKPFIDINESDRPNDNYIVIGALASGDPIIFKKGEDKIAIYNHADNCIEDDEIYVNFYAFLNDLYDVLGIGG